MRAKGESHQNETTETTNRSKQKKSLQVLFPHIIIRLSQKEKENTNFHSLKLQNDATVEEKHSTDWLLDGL